MPIIITTVLPLEDFGVLQYSLNVFIQLL